MGLQVTQALALWLEGRPQLGHDVFARGWPEVFGVSVETAPVLDMTEFLWASLALFNDEPAPDTTTLYRPQFFDLHDVSEARARIRQLLAAAPAGGTLDRFLPDPPEEAGGRPDHVTLRRRSAWCSTLVASLELAGSTARCTWHRMVSSHPFI